MANHKTQQDAQRSRTIVHFKIISLVGERLIKSVGRYSKQVTLSVARISILIERPLFVSSHTYGSKRKREVLLVMTRLHSSRSEGWGTREREGVTGYVTATQTIFKWSQVPIMTEIMSYTHLLPPNIVKPISPSRQWILQTDTRWLCFHCSLLTTLIDGSPEDFVENVKTPGNIKKILELTCSQVEHHHLPQSSQRGHGFSLSFKISDWFHNIISNNTGTQVAYFNLWIQY